MTLEDCQTLAGARSIPRTESSPWIRRWPHVGFSLAKRITTWTVPAGMLGRPGDFG